MRLPLDRLSEVASLNGTKQFVHSELARAIDISIVKDVPPFVWEKQPPNARAYRQAKAQRQVQDAVKRGELPNLRTVETPCVDCGVRATDWEHRDYSAPLVVEPVCRSCNCLRGAAA